MKIPVLLLVTLGILSCSRNQPAKENTDLHSPEVLSSGILMADTIIYDVIIRNPDPDDNWTAACLKGLNRSALVDTLFDLVYKEKLAAYDFDTHQKLSYKDVKLIEAGDAFQREKIGKIQFRERWYYDASAPILRKELISLVLGYEVFDDAGELRGYKPVFQLYFK